MMTTMTTTMMIMMIPKHDKIRKAANMNILELD